MTHPLVDYYLRDLDLALAGKDPGERAGTAPRSGVGRLWTALGLAVVAMLLAVLVLAGMVAFKTVSNTNSGTVEVVGEA